MPSRDALGWKTITHPHQNPAPTVELIKSRLKIYPYAQGGWGTPIGTLLEGRAQPNLQPNGQPNLMPAEIPDTKFVEGSGKAFNTIPPRGRDAERAGAARRKRLHCFRMMTGHGAGATMSGRGPSEGR